MPPPGTGGRTGTSDYERGGSRYGRGGGGFGPSGFADPDGPGGRLAGPRGSLGAMDAEGFGPRGSAGASGYGTGAGRAGQGFGTAGYGAAEGAAGRGGGLGARGAGGGAGGGLLGPAAAAGGTQRDNDGEHKRKYLVASDEYFADDRLVPPPVIGETPHG
jgi:hypothetical protein